MISAELFDVRTQPFLCHILPDSTPLFLLPHPRSHTDRIGRKPQSVTAAGAALNCCPAATEKAHLPKKEQFQIKTQHPCTIQTQRTLRAPNSTHHPIINEGGKPFSFGEGVHRTLISW